MTMQLDHDELHRLLATLADSDINEFRLEGEDFCLEIKRNLTTSSFNTVESTIATSPQQQVAPPLTQETQPGSTLSPSIDPPPSPGSRTDLLEVTAPMVGTFYRAPSPDDPPFVEVGTRVAVGQTVCILEAMKLMNELESEVGGEIIEIMVENGTPVEFGQVLMRVKPV
ncbi:acetyl-CoA carboxylase biotin carboxyl carrier protein [Prochlorococcus sp. MIT 1223]|uniref:acetyl-CoA carboxylase biotin carboxyl carrier protein n=1 Tax=Prochlorococcus sp. MIT 1223 TaxID=3096217 RepID=UPI002A753ABB|nr:acetyl-CoA carboxylase biotin carboxyl carrier protein [Prochlorococcus sp. MIT 1223]